MAAASFLVLAASSSAAAWPSLAASTSFSACSAPFSTVLFAYCCCHSASSSFLFTSFALRLRDNGALPLRPTKFAMKLFDAELSRDIAKVIPRA